MTPIRYLLISLTLAVVSTAVGSTLSGRVTKQLSRLIPRTSVSLTRGDEILAERVAAGKARSFKVLGFLLVTVFAAFVVSIIANYVSSLLFS